MDWTMLLKKTFSHVKSVEQWSIQWLKDSHISCPPQTSFMISAWSCIADSCSSLVISNTGKVKWRDKTTFLASFYFSFPPLCSCLWKKRWTVFPYLAWEVIQHRLEWGKLPSELKTSHLKTVIAVWKTSVRAVKQPWSLKGKEGRQEQSQHSFEVKKASQQFATQRMESTPTIWSAELAQKRGNTNIRLCVFDL